MLDYSKLDVPESLITYMETYAINSDEQVLYFLEQYRYYTQAQLVDYLNDSLPFSVVAVHGVERSTQFAKLETLNDVVITSDGTVATVYFNALRDDYEDMQSAVQLTVLFNDLAMVFVGVTPYTFAVISGRALQPLKPLFMFERILADAVAKSATDIHFCVSHDQGCIGYPLLYRINGELCRQAIFELTELQNKEIISSLVEKRTKTNALDLLESSGVTASSVSELDNSIELRISANKVRDGYHYVIRVQRRETVSYTIDQLGFAPSITSALKNVAKKQNGITFITGAIRTGKNTTAFAIANEMSKLPIKIVSYESPIEVLMPFPQVDYRESESVLLDAIHLAKKQDVNVAFINEIPSKEVAFAVRDLVNSSIHVITTMHMNRVWHLPYKLKEYYGEQYKDIISQINAVFNQKMFPKSCPFCRHSVLAADIAQPAVRDFLIEHGISGMTLSTGCAKCNYTGNAPGSNQPYAEFIIFTDILKSKLLQCVTPAEMEMVLRDEVNDSSLENFMLDSVHSGQLNPSALTSIL